MLFPDFRFPSCISADNSKIKYKARNRKKKKEKSLKPQALSMPIQLTGIKSTKAVLFHFETYVSTSFSCSHQKQVGKETMSSQIERKWKGKEKGKGREGDVARGKMG